MRTFQKPVVRVVTWLTDWALLQQIPLWLAPDQVRVITFNDDAALINHAQPIVAELRANRVRVDADFSAKPKGEVVAEILASIKERRA